MLEDKYIGLSLAVASSFLIGVSFIITKKGLIETSLRNENATSTFQYLKSPVWWIGMVTMALGEIANFAAYSFAPAILVTPLGALSVLISAILASWLLKEEMGTAGKSGSALCLVGAVMIVLHAPEDKEILSVDDILRYALHPSFLAYVGFVVCFALFMIFNVAPEYGKRSVLVYVSICSLVGSVSVMAVKGFGIALKLTFAGMNQLTHPSTYIFAVVVLVSVLTQLNYFNKALDQFSTNVVTPIYYVTFTTATIVASIILFQGVEETDAKDAMSLVCGFLTIFIGVFLLNNSSSMDKKSTLALRMSGNRRREGHARILSGSLSGYTRVSQEQSTLEEEEEEEGSTDSTDDDSVDRSGRLARQV